eukprot:20133-Heterococcus_DN1.PRE.3
MSIRVTPPSIAALPMILYVRGFLRNRPPTPRPNAAPDSSVGMNSPLQTHAPNVRHSSDMKVVKNRKHVYQLKACSPPKWNSAFRACCGCACYTYDTVQ